MQLGGQTHDGRTMEYTKNLEAKIDSLTVEEVSTVFRKYMDASKLSVFKAGDFAKVSTPK
jgi:zinc protease